MCRLGAVKISLIKPELASQGVELVGIGLEQLGAEEFVQREFLNGEVYVDEKKQCYQDLGFRRFSWLTVFKALVSAVTRKTLSEAKERKIDGNLSGDGLQNGGLLIVRKGGTEVLLFHKEQMPGDHVSNEIILDTLGITSQKNIITEEITKTDEDCTEECSLPPSVPQ